MSSCTSLSKFRILFIQSFSMVPLLAPVPYFNPDCFASSLIVFPNPSIFSQSTLKSRSVKSGLLDCIFFYSLNCFFCFFLSILIAISFDSIFVCNELISCSIFYIFPTSSFYSFINFCRSLVSSSNCFPTLSKLYRQCSKCS